MSESEIIFAGRRLQLRSRGGPAGGALPDKRFLPRHEGIEVSFSPAALQSYGRPVNRCARTSTRLCRAGRRISHRRHLACYIPTWSPFGAASGLALPRVPGCLGYRQRIRLRLAVLSLGSRGAASRSPSPLYVPEKARAGGADLPAACWEGRRIVVPDDICRGQEEGGGRCHSARPHPGSSRNQVRTRSVSVTVFAHVSGAVDGAMP